MTIDLNASTTGAIADPLTIGTVIATSTIRNAGVEQIFSATKPTTRVGGSALVADDLWYDTATNTHYFWNGTLWLTTQEFIFTSATLGSTSVGTKLCETSLRASGTSFDKYGIFLSHYDYYMAVVGAVGVSDFFTLRPRYQFASTGESAFGTTSPNLNSASNFGRVVENLVIPTAAALGGNIPARFAVTLAVGGGAPTVPQNLIVSFVTRLIAP